MAHLLADFQGDAIYLDTNVLVGLVEGRLLLVVYVRRNGGRYVISARDMSEGEKRRVRRLSGR